MGVDEHIATVTILQLGSRSFGGDFLPVTQDPKILGGQHHVSRQDPPPPTPYLPGLPSHTDRQMAECSHMAAWQKLLQGFGFLLTQLRKGKTRPGQRPHLRQSDVSL